MKFSIKFIEYCFDNHTMIFEITSKKGELKYKHRIILTFQHKVSDLAYMFEQGKELILRMNERDIRKNKVLS